MLISKYKNIPIIIIYEKPLETVLFFLILHTHKFLLSYDKTEIAIYIL